MIGRAIRVLAAMGAIAQLRLLSIRLAVHSCIAGDPDCTADRPCFRCYQARRA